MNMLRHYFISDSLDDLEVLEEQLESAGVSTPQIHVLSRNDAEVENHHHLHAVQSFLKRDIVRSTERGAVVGLCAFVLVLSVAYFAGWRKPLPAGSLSFSSRSCCSAFPRGWVDCSESKNPTTTSFDSNKP